MAVCRTTKGSEAHVNTAVRISASLGLHDFEQHTTTGRNSSFGIVTVAALADDVHEPVAVATPERSTRRRRALRWPTRGTCTA